MKCKKCGNITFYGAQRVEKVETVIVDANGMYMGTATKPGFIHPDECILNASKPCGPFVCSVCGAIYKEDE